MHVVGEEGPELEVGGINTSRVYNQRQLAFMAGGGQQQAVPTVHYAPVYNLSGVETQKIVEYIEDGRKRDQKGMLTMLYNNGFGRMRA